MSSAKRSDVQTDSSGRKTVWLWLLAAVIALAFLFAVVRWVVGGHG